MGYHCDNIYIGPAIKIVNAPTITSTHTINTCKSDVCKTKHYLSTKFCPQCGTSVGEVTYSEIGEASFYDFMNDPSGKYAAFGNILMKPNHDKDNVLLPNSKMKGMYAFWGDIDERTITIGDTFEENKAAQTKIFEGLHDAALIALREYGFEIKIVYIIKTFGY